jgi:hypothetical protein
MEDNPGWKIALLRIVGIPLCIIGLVAGYFWFYHWGPMRRVFDPAWYRQHSEAAYWEEYQECVRRSGWTHDGGFIVGRLGDKRWVQWIMDHVRSDDDLLGCRAGHKDHALRFLTNQDAGHSAADWRAWWEQNKSKSQEDWVREGFHNYGVDLHTPLTPANTIALLKLAAYTERQKDSAPDYVQYNAFRWLRDSDFDPEKLAIKDIPTKDADRVLQGLVRFARLSGKHPKSDGVGVLNLGEQPKYADYPPIISTLRFRILANMLIFGSFGAGLLLLLASFRLKRRKRTISDEIQEGG